MNFCLRISSLKRWFLKVIIKECNSLSSFSNLDILPVKKGTTSKTKEINDCLICKVMAIKNEKADLVKLVFSSEETISEKVKLASLLTGLEFDKEMIECIENPTINQFLFSD